jgi:hypothetical protein
MRARTRDIGAGCERQGVVRTRSRLPLRACSMWWMEVVYTAMKAPGGKGGSGRAARQHVCASNEAASSRRGLCSVRAAACVRARAPKPAAVSTVRCACWLCAWGEDGGVSTQRWRCCRQQGRALNAVVDSATTQRSCTHRRAQQRTPRQTCVVAPRAWRAQQRASAHVRCLCLCKRAASEGATSSAREALARVARLRAYGSALAHALVRAPGGAHLRTRIRVGASAPRARTHTNVRACVDTQQAPPAATQRTALPCSVLCAARSRHVRSRIAVCSVADMACVRACERARAAARRVAMSVHVPLLAWAELRSGAFRGAPLRPPPSGARVPG